MAITITLNSAAPVNAGPLDLEKYQFGSGSQPPASPCPPVSPRKPPVYGPPNPVKHVVTQCTAAH